MVSDDINKNFSVELRVKVGGDSEPTFVALKELQSLGYANEDSTILLKNVRVPAGYCSDFQHFIVTYGAIVSGDHALTFDQIPSDFSELKTVKFLAVCSTSMESQGRVGFTQDEVKNFLEYRKSQKSLGQK